MKILIFILIYNIIPIFLLISFGFILERKFNLDIFSLSKLNFYIFVPGFVLVNLYTTNLPTQMSKVLIALFAFMFITGGIAEILAKIRKYDNGLKNAFKNSIMFYNSGNIGLPLITLVFSTPPFVPGGQAIYLDAAITVHIIIMVFQNITINTVGFFNSGIVNGKKTEAILEIFKMPTVYVIPIVIIMRTIPYDFTQSFFWPALEHIKYGLVSVALITLGVQLGKTSFKLTNIDVYLSAFIKLIATPIMVYIIIKILKLEGIPAQVLMVALSAPTAVNTALIAVECKNKPDFASQTVITSTLLSSLTLTLVIYFARILFPVSGIMGFNV
jgi:predicted permease